MTDMILHPTAATAVPVTHVKAGKSGKAREVRKSRDLTNEELRALVKARGLKPSMKHTKAELRHMLTTGQQITAAAQVRENATRRAKRAAAKTA